MSNKNIFVTRPSLPPQKEYIGYISEIWDSGWVTNGGPLYGKLTKELEMWLDADYIELFSNGHMALELALNALQLHGEVITTPFTFVSTTNAIIRSGLHPVFCDINESDYTIAVDQLESLITEKTVAIVPVHVYGNVCDVEKIRQIAEKYNLKVVYDASHAFGETYKGKSIATFGDMSTFSFHATKVFNTIEGGAVVCKNVAYQKILSELKNFGLEGSDGDVKFAAPNAKLNEFQAAMGLCNLKYLKEQIENRRIIFEKYVERLQDIKGLVCNTIQEEVQSNYAYFPIYVDPEQCNCNRDELIEALEKDNVYPRKYFYPLVTEYTYYRSSYHAEETPIALKLSKGILTLPLYGGLEIKDVERICDVIRRRCE